MGVRQPAGDRMTMRYRTIVADPPWEYRSWISGGFGWRKGRPSGEAGSGSLPYETLTIDALAELPVASWAADDAHLYVWATQRYLERAYGVVRAWGFEPSCVLVWCKEPRGFGLGGAYASTVEFVVFARRGREIATRREMTQWFRWPRGEHSAKPEAFMDMVESVSPGPYLELFARRARFGWDYWGDESLGTVTIEAAS